MGQRKPFDLPWYATRGVMATLSPDMQMILFRMIFLLRDRTDIPTDYLQIFELSPNRDLNAPLNQEIVHKQEQPPYRATNLEHSATPVNAKIYVIDDGTHATMLLAEEY